VRLAKTKVVNTTKARQEEAIRGVEPKAIMAPPRFSQIWL